MIYKQLLRYRSVRRTFSNSPLKDTGNRFGCCSACNSLSSLSFPLSSEYLSLSEPLDLIVSGVFRDIIGTRRVRIEVEAFRCDEHECRET